MMQQQPILIGVDGGGSRCRVRACSPDGRILGEAEGGAANIFTDLGGALATVVAVAQAALAAGGLGPEDLRRCHAGLGLAGANVPSLADASRRQALPFAAHALASDAVIACLGAHAGGDGAIAILGTGTAYGVHAGGVFTSLGGWGSLLSDHGGGARLGRSALAASLLALDGLGPSSGMTDAVLERFGRDAAGIVEFAARATPGEFGAFAPFVMDAADAADPVAGALVGGGVVRIEAALARMLDLGAPSLALLGGLAARYRPRLSPVLRSRMIEPRGDAMDGALTLARSLLDPVDADASGRPAA